MGDMDPADYTGATEGKGTIGLRGNTGGGTVVIVPGKYRVLPIKAEGQLSPIGLRLGGCERNNPTAENRAEKRY